MNRLKLIYTGILTGGILAVSLVSVETAEAQWGIGASYELRDEDPAGGFGLRVENDILSFPVGVDLGLRGHFSMFNDENEVSEGSVQYSSDIQSYDFGLAALAGLKIGLLKPYVGLGLGSENFEEVRSGAQNQSFSENSLYWNLFIGADLAPFPIVKPFIEYRFTRLFDDEGFNYNQNGRLAVGVLVTF